MEILLFIVFLGLTQGFTEFLPISSSGHLALMENLPMFQDMNVLLQEQYSLLAFNVILHMGTILAVIFYWYKDLLDITVKFFSDIKNRQQGEGFNIVLKIVISTLPVFSVPFFRHFVEETVNSLGWICLFFVINGLLLIGAHFIRKRKNVESNFEKTLQDMSKTDALIIGIFQVFAVFPGISRSGSTITAALIQRIKGVDSVKYSFLISIPVLLGAAIFEIKEAGFYEVFSVEAKPLWIFTGLLSSFLAGLLSLKALVWLGRKTLFYPFGVYTILLGSMVYLVIGV